MLERSSGSCNSDFLADGYCAGRIIILCHCCCPHRFAVRSRVAEIKYLASHMWGAKNWWQVAVVSGIAIGAFVSMRLSGARRQVISPVWARATATTTLAARAPLAFLAGFIMLFGARIAGGCTNMGQLCRESLRQGLLLYRIWNQ